jgi:DNA helicase-2/ATP-dependent DNA helicase PcrA
LHTYQEKFRYILVDEYQDTNYAQYLIVNRLGDKHKNVCVVGDDAQSIYSFRGAKIENILNFKNDYPGYSMYKLEQNYRSTKTIVNAGNSIIDKNRDQIKKTIFSKNEEGDKIQVMKAFTDMEEGFMVSNSIFDTILNEQVQYSEFSILYRTNAQSRIFEEALRKRNIPYRVYGSISFYQRKEIKDLISYLRLLVNPSDDEALKRIINFPARGIGKTTLEKLEEYATSQDISLWQVLQNLKSLPGLFNRGTIEKLTAFRDFIAENQGMARQQNAYEVARHIASSTGMLKELYNGLRKS